MKLIEAFEQHGINFTHTDPEQSRGVCCFCGREKFFVNPMLGLWDCKTCMLSGNLEQFLERKHPQYIAQLKGQAAFDLAKSRSISALTFKAWGVGYCSITKQYMLPQTVPHFVNISRYTIGGKMFSTSSAKVGVFAPTQHRDTQQVYLCEGPWDAMALSECTQDACYATPGVGNLSESCLEFFSGKDIILIGDCDKVNPKTGKSAGNAGVTRLGEKLSGTAKSIKYMHWPDTTSRDGYGVRQLYRDIKQDALKFIQENLREAPPQDAAAPVTATDSYSGQELTREQVLLEYRKWLFLPNPEVLDVIYAAAFANQIQTDPLWLFIVGPPGSCKTELLQSLSEAKHMAGATTMTPQSLVSGCNHAGADPSLIPKLNGKTLIIKDFTTILSMNQQSRDEIFGILRDAYDGKIEKWFGNGAHRLYYSRFGILAGVTAKIEELGTQNAALGERFIKYRFKAPGRIDVGREAIQASLKGVLTSSAMREQLKLIGKKVLARTIKPDEIPSLNAQVAERLTLLAQFVACLRGVVSRDRFSGNVLNKPQAEIGTRLAKQFCALAMGLALYKRESIITPETLDTILNIAKDTAPDRVEELVKQLYIMSLPDKSVCFSAGAVAERTRLPVGTINYMLQDLNMLHIVKLQRERLSTWRIDFGVRNLIEKVGLYQKEKGFASK